ncbi:MAG: type III pantothenate kinase [Rhodothermales bacterium]|nr:type III pantothenate kinase [Rhodothermales bacterium]
MICAVDVGNSSLKGGLFEKGRLEETFRISLEEGHHVAVSSLLDKVRSSGTSYLGVSSVVPTVSDAISNAAAPVASVSVFVLSHRAKLPFSISYETLDTLGVDRIAAAAGAWKVFGGNEHRPIIVVDAGTAVTADVVADGALLGGMIFPGPELQRRAVRSGTAQLPVVDLEWPRRAIARGTREAIATGIMLSFVEGVRGILVRIIDELSRQPHIVSTGGWGRLLADKISLIEMNDGDLVLRGLAAIMEINRAPTAR